MESGSAVMPVRAKGAIAFGNLINITSNANLTCDHVSLPQQAIGTEHQNNRGRH